MNELIAHIEAQNARAQAWMDEAPGRWAGMITTDPEHWAEYGITTVEEYERHMMIECYHDVFKSAYGVKPRYINFDEKSLEDMQADIEQMARTNRS